MVGSYKCSPLVFVSEISSSVPVNMSGMVYQMHGVNVMTSGHPCRCLQLGCKQCLLELEASCYDFKLHKGFLNSV